MRLAYRYRLFTNANQERELAAALETHRRLYNVCFDYKELAYQCFGASLNHGDFSRWFKGQRGTNPYFARLNFSSAQATMRRLDKSFANFFRRVAEAAFQGTRLVRQHRVSRLAETKLTRFGCSCIFIVDTWRWR